MFSKTKQLSRLSYPRQRHFTSCDADTMFKLPPGKAIAHSKRKPLCRTRHSRADWRVSNVEKSSMYIMLWFVASVVEQPISKLSVKFIKAKQMTSMYKQHIPKLSKCTKIEYLLGNLKPTFRTGANLVAWTSRDHATHCAGRTHCL